MVDGANDAVTVEGIQDVTRSPLLPAMPNHFQHHCLIVPSPEGQDGALGLHQLPNVDVPGDDSLVEALPA